MKRFLSCIMCIFLFSGCGVSSGELDIAVSLRQRLNQSKGFSFECQITADYADALYEFTLSCSCDPLGEMRFQVISPETICGISGQVDQRGGELTFDDQLLAFPLLADGYLSPVSAPWLMLKALRGGYIASAGTDSSGYFVTINDTYAEETMQVDIWLDKEQNPYYCQILWQGRRLLSIAVSNFIYL